MNPKLQAIAQDLRKMEPGRRSDWLIENFPIESPDYWEVFQVIPHVSWKRTEQIRLAKYYLSRRPLASSAPYAAFASLMSFSLFNAIIGELIPADNGDRELFLYHLLPVLERYAKTMHDKEIMNSLLQKLK